MVVEFLFNIGGYYNENKEKLKFCLGRIYKEK